MSSGITKCVVCLANSWKHDGRCVAVKEIRGAQIGQWLRPVSNREGGSLSVVERNYAGNIEPAIGDIFRIGLLGISQHAYQSENAINNDRQRWAFERKATFNELVACVDECAGPIWIDGRSSFNGLNDKISLDPIPRIQGSLKYIRLPSLGIKVQVEEYNGVSKKRYRGVFTYNQARYILSITDPLIQAKYAQSDEGTYFEEDALICVSLGVPLNGYAYKLIASVITKGL